MFTATSSELRDTCRSPGKSYLFFLTVEQTRLPRKSPWNQIGWREGEKAGKAAQSLRRLVRCERTVKIGGKD